MSDWKNPDHYKKQGFEAIDIIKSVLTPEQYSGYLIGNSLKYLLRVNDKDLPFMNMGKATWYSDRAEEFLRDQHDDIIQRQD
jgi:hypothetical protein